MQAVEQDIRAFITKNFFSSDPFADEDSLFDKGIVDSTGVLEVVQFIEETDGSRILDRFITAGHREQWESFQRLGPLLLIGVFVVGGYILSGPIAAVHGVLDRLISAIAG